MSFNVQAIGSPAEVFGKVGADKYVPDALKKAIEDALANYSQDVGVLVDVNGHLEAPGGGSWGDVNLKIMIRPKT